MTKHRFFTLGQNIHSFDEPSFDTFAARYGDVMSASSTSVVFNFSSFAVFRFLELSQITKIALLSDLIKLRHRASSFLY